MREDILPPGRSLRPLAWAGGCIGFSLGGFFDGILLHQVLQWHHLLSRVRSPCWKTSARRSWRTGCSMP